MKGIVVKQNGKVCEMQFENTSMEHLAKLCGFNSKNKFKRYHTYHEGNYFYSVFGKTNGRAGSENKYELPPPIDNKLFFHTMFILKSTKPSNTSYIHMKNIQDLSVSDWKKVYENLFGGFEDLGETESSSEDELKHIDKNHLTKQGYLKDDFVIEDEDDEDEDEDEDEEDEDEDEEDEDEDEEDEDEDDEDEDDDEEDDEDEDEDEDEDDDEEAEDEDDLKNVSKSLLVSKSKPKKGKDRFSLKIDPEKINIEFKNNDKNENMIVIDDTDELTEDSFI